MSSFMRNHKQFSKTNHLQGPRLSSDYASVGEGAQSGVYILPSSRPGNAPSLGSMHMSLTSRAKGLMPTSARGLAGGRHEQSLGSLPTSPVTNPKFGIRWKQTGSFSFSPESQTWPRTATGCDFQRKAFLRKNSLLLLAELSQKTTPTYCYLFKRLLGTKMRFN